MKSAIRSWSLCLASVFMIVGDTVLAVELPPRLALPPPLITPPSFDHLPAPDRIRPSLEHVLPPSIDRPSVDRPSSLSSPASSISAAPLLDDSLERARTFRNSLRSIQGNEIICRAIGHLFEATPSAGGCTRWVTNEKQTVAYQITVLDSAGKMYEVELLGASSELALKKRNWVERHRFYVAFGFDGRLEPLVTVFNFEPMLRTTPNLFPIKEELFEHINRENDSLLRVLQERVKSSISATLQSGLEKPVVGIK